jgi:hypothetical protein
MPTMSLRIAAAVVAALLAPASRAAAETVNISLDQTPLSAQVSVYYNIGGVPGNTTASPGPYIWAQSAPLDAGLPTTLATFCVELDQHFPTSPAPYTVTTPTAAVGAADAALISKLYAAHYNPAWEARGYLGSVESAAFQLALWEIVYDGPGNLNLANGHVWQQGVNLNDKSTPGGLAQSWLGGLSSVPDSAFGTTYGNSQLVWLTNSTYQDQIVIVPKPHGVPAPAGGVLAVIGGLALAGRRLTRRPVAV